jgi:hypothetical protein
MREEVSSIMSPGGLRFEWRSLAGVTGHEVFSELAVAKFKGECDAVGILPTRREPEALAWSHVTDGVVLPFTDVDCDRIRGFLQNKLAGMDVGARDRVFGRAVGRILAHELFHIFARKKGHGSRRVDKPYYTVGDLVADDFDLEEKESHILRVAKTASAAAKGFLPRAKNSSLQPGSSAYFRNGCNTCHGSEGLGTRHGPALRVRGEWIDSVVLAARLEKGGVKMSRRAKDLKVPRPSLAEEELSELVRFLNSPLP